MKYQGIIFDFNGVMLWDTEWHNEAWLKITKELLGKPVDITKIDEFHGRTCVEIFRGLLGDDLSDEKADELSERKEALYRSIALSKGKFFSLSHGCAELLDLLKKHSVARNIATASIKTNLDFFIKSFDLGRWFDLGKIIYDNGNLPGKPAPEMYILAAEKIGLGPEACIVVEDSKMGLLSAKNAGAGKIIALGPKDKQKELADLPYVDKAIVTLNEITLAYFGS